MLKQFKIFNGTQALINLKRVLAIRQLGTGSIFVLNDGTQINVEESYEEIVQDLIRLQIVKQ